jgi:1-acyl-sn-glycerol-3-phosphate acyltransferase
MAAEHRHREVPRISAVTLRFFRGIVRRYFRRHFRSVMVQHEERLAEVEGPLIVFANHSSWWDPMVLVLLAQHLLPQRNHYAPMDALALQRYPILRKIGIFPVEMASARGAAQFLRTSQSILAAGGVLWITPQGRFADPRAQPLGFKPGLGALAARTQATLVPLAIEYTFWDERLPETLLHLGEPMRIAAGMSHEEATARLETALAASMQALSVDAIARDAGAFRVLLRGGRGSGGVYGLARRVRSAFSGKRAQIDHTQREETTIPPRTP